MLTELQQALRKGKVTASFAPFLAAGDEAAILHKYYELTNDPRWEPEDLSRNWAVQLGSYLERFVIDWHAHRTGAELMHRGEVIIHPERNWLCCTLDAFRDNDATVIDCKWVGAHRNLTDAIAYYTPQMVVQRQCTGARGASLLITHGGSEPSEYEIYLTEEYETQILNAIDTFWRCVQTRTPPVAIPPAPPPPEMWRKIDLDIDADKFNWSADLLAAAETWAATKEAATTNSEAAKTIKTITPEDVGELFAGPITVTRNRARALSIKARSL